MDEQTRIKEVFDNWYYKGFSVTTKKERPKGYSQLGLFNEYLKWRVFLDIFNRNKLNLLECKILDAGCGNGNAIRQVIDHGALPENCCGVDISWDAVEYAKKNSPVGVDYRQGFIHDLPYENHSFDIVFCLGVLIHILDDDYIRIVSDEFHRVLKKDGLAIILVSDSDLGGNWGELSDVTRNFSSSKKELESLFTKFDYQTFYNSHNDSYPANIQFSEVLKYLETNYLKTCFKTYVFTPRA